MPAMNAVERYVRRTIKEAAREALGGPRHDKAEAEARGVTLADIQADNLKGALEDATRGADTGWWSDLIYTRDVYRMAAANRKAIAEAVAEYVDETAASLDATPDTAAPARPHYGLGEVLAACTLAPTFKAWEDTGTVRYEDVPAEAHADALMFGLRFAVEWYAGKMANEAGL